MKKLTSILLTIVMLLSTIVFPVSTQKIYAQAAYTGNLTEADRNILEVVWNNMEDYLEFRNNAIDKADYYFKTVKQLLVGINIAEWTGSNVIGSIKAVLGDPSELISIAMNTTYQEFASAISYISIYVGKAYVDEGLDYLNEMYDLCLNGDISNPDTARKIYKYYLYGIALYRHGRGYWEPYYKKVQENGGTVGIMLNAICEDQWNRNSTAWIPGGSTGLKLYDFFYNLGSNIPGTANSFASMFAEEFGKFSTTPLYLEQIEKSLKVFDNVYSLSASYPVSISYNNSSYYKSLKYVKLTGNQRTDLVNVALSQVGYHEGNSTMQLNGKNTSGSQDYTEYAYWFGTQVKGNSYGHYYAWCAMFISWCARQARIPTSVISNAAYACADGSSKKGGYSYFHMDYNNRGAYTPQPGDLIFFGNWDHVGIVYKVANGKVYTVEGNNDNSVKKSSYSLNSSYIKCYGVPKYTSSMASSILIYNAYLSNYFSNSSFYTTGSYIITAKSGLNARSQPNANSTILSGWSYGTTVNVTATKGNWGYTSRGWICLDYAELVSGTTSSYDSTANYDVGNYVVTTTAGLNCRKGVGTSYAVIKALPYGTSFSVTQTDGAWGYCPEYGGWLCLNYAMFTSTLTPSLPIPKTPILSTTTKVAIGVNEMINVSWENVDTATTYLVRLIDAKTGAEVKSQNVSSTNASLIAPYAGIFNVSVSAKNSQHTSEEATLYGFNVKAPLTVTFKNWDGTTISAQTVTYGKDAKAPTAPSRVGHTFSKWDGDYTAVREDCTITATYTKNKYTVTFCDYDGTVIDTQEVYYGDAATAPAYEAPTGYSFVKWDSSFNNITKATTVKAVISWTSLYPLEISTSSAVERNNKSYIVTSIVNNSPHTVSDAKIIAVIKTKENKLLATVESEKLTLAKGEVKNLTLTASYDGMATKAEIFVVKANDENIPLAKHFARDIDQGTAWSAWSTSIPPADALQTQSRTEYRYRDKSFTTSASSSLSGWTKYDSTYKLVWGAEQGPVSSNPGTSETRKSRSESIIASTTHYYNYYRYANSSGSSGNSIKTGDYTNYEEINLTYALTNKSSTIGGDGVYGYKAYYNNSNYNTVSGNYRTYWYLNESDKHTYKTVWYYTDATKVYTYYFYKWGDWSSWSPNSTSATSDREVETRTTYRYLANTANNIETTAGVEINRNGIVDTSYANRQALLFVSDKSGATQFVGQTVIGTDGSYAFKFKTKDEPTVTSGDYKVMLSIEGSSAAFELEPIKAPVPEYTVKFVDYDGTVVSEQTVKQGEDASVPAPLSREGYRFIGWDNSYTNIQGNITINAQYEIKSFDVVFVDEINDTSVVEIYNYGDTLVVPEVTLNDAYNFLGWDVVIDGKTKVTENMVVTAKFEKKMFTVDFLDFDGSILESKSIEYGDAVAESVLLNRDNYVFISWSPSSDLNYVTEDIIVTPIFEYAETVLAPTANITTGAYNDELVVTLSTETEGAKIYYTTDGTVPNVPDITFKAERNEFDLLEKSNGVLYTEPFTIDSSANLIYVAVKDGMNNSEISQEVYAVNTDESGEKRHLVNVHYNITDETISYLVDDGMPLPEFNMDLDENGYDLTGMYKDSEYKNTWSADTDVVTDSTDIYLKWEKETYLVKFIGFDGKVISEQSVRYMEDAVVPEITSVKGYVFKYWDTGYTSVTKDITVKAVYAPENEVTTVVLNKDALTFIEGQSEMLTATVKLGTDSENDALIWQSSDEDVVIVDDNGKITAVAVGTATIFAISEDSGMSAQCEVTVDYKDPCAALGHKHEGKVTAPTCTEKGYTTYTCLVCGDTYTANEKASLGHNMSEMIPIFAPSCENEGQNMIKCIRCEYSEIQQIEATGHCDNDGNNICDDCGKELLASSKCSCNCHKTGFMSFIWKILRFFYKLFRMNKVCGCGVSHY